MSMTITVGAVAAGLLGHEHRRAQTIVEQFAIGKPGQIVVNGVMEHALFGRLELGHVGQRADHPTTSPSALITGRAFRTYQK